MKINWRQTQSAVKKYGSHGSVDRISSEIQNGGIEVIALTPGTPDYFEAIKDIQQKENEKKGRQGRGNKLSIGRKIVESQNMILKPEHQSKMANENFIGKIIIEENQQKIQPKECLPQPRNEENNSPAKKMHYLEMLDNLKTIEENNDVNAKELWTRINLFITCFDNWLQSKPGKIVKVEIITRRFIKIMQKNYSAIITLQNSVELLNSLAGKYQDFVSEYKNCQQLLPRNVQDKIKIIETNLFLVESKEQSNEYQKLQDRLKKAIGRFINICSKNIDMSDVIEKLSINLDEILVILGGAFKIEKK